MNVPAHSYRISRASGYRNTRQCLIYAAALLANATSAGAWQTLPSIRAAAEQHAVSAAAQAGNVGAIATAAPLDARLQVAECGGDLQTFTLHGAATAARSTIGVRCAQGADWTVYVPVNVESEIPVLVLRATLTRGASVQPTDVELQHRRVPGGSGDYLADPALLRDRHLKRTSTAGTVLTTALLERTPTVRRGQQVLLLLDAPGVNIQAPGVALADGATADRIQVRNLSSLKVVEGVVESANAVRVRL